MKYITQKSNSGTCGPVAIYNAMKWLGRLSNLDAIVQQTKCTRKYGTAIKNITKFLKANSVNFSYKQKINNKQIKKELDNGNAVIYLYQTGCYFAHYVLIIGYGQYNQELMFDVVNERFSIDRFCSPIMPIPAKFYSRCASNASFLLWKHGRRYPQAWIIKKDTPKMS